MSSSLPDPVHHVTVSTNLSQNLGVTGWELFGSVMKEQGGLV